MRYLRWSAVLRKHLDPGDCVLPIDKDDFAKLALALPPGETALLVLRDDMGREEVEVGVVGGYPTLVRRRIEGEPDHVFPRGSTIGFEVTVEMVKHLICNHDCCSDGPCPVEPPSVAGKLFAEAVVGEPWYGTVVFSGALPLSLGVGALPAWIKVESGPSYLRLSGVPPEAGTVSVGVAATNRSGEVVVDSTSVVVSEPH